MSQLEEALNKIICPLCGSEMEIDFYPHGFHPAEYECPECGYNTGESEIETLKLFIEQFEDASISGCNSPDIQLRYSMIAKWLKELLEIKIKETN